MNSIILNILSNMLFLYSRIFGVFYDHKFKYRYAWVKNKVFTYSVAKYFKNFGENVKLSSTCTLKNPQYISISNGTSVGERCVITAWDSHGDQRYNPEIFIGKNTSIGTDCHITAIGTIRIGSGVLLGKFITITDNSHGSSSDDLLSSIPVSRDLVSKGAVIIEDNVWIGDKATILPAVTIGRGSIIGANSVVTKDVAPGSVVAGNPARLVKSTQVGA